jgi:hypothetical protein
MPTVVLGDPYGNQQTASGAARNVAAMLGDGICGAQADGFTNPGSLASLLGAADAAGGRFRVGYHLDLSVLRDQRESVPAMEQAAVAATEAWCRLGALHSSAERAPSGALVVWVYSPSEIGADAWQWVRSQVALDGYDVFWIGGDPATPAGWDATWSFVAGHTSAIWTVMPQYTRPRMPVLDKLTPDGGRRLRQELAAVPKGRAVLIVSWNDTGDGTQVEGPLEVIVKAWSSGPTFPASASP